MKRLQDNFDSNSEKKLTKISPNNKSSVIFIKNDLDIFREQQPIGFVRSPESYQTKSLVHSEHEKKIIETFNPILPIEYHSWENSVVYHSNNINLSMVNEAGWIPTRQYRTLAMYQKEVLGRNVDFIENIQYDEKNRITNWHSIFPFNDCFLLKNLMDSKNDHFDLNYKSKYIHPEQDSCIIDLPNEPSIDAIRKENPTIHSTTNSFKKSKESRLHRTRNVLARAGLVGILPDENHENSHCYRDKYDENTKTKSISFWNLSNDIYYDINIEQDFLHRRRINSTQNLDLIIYPIFRTIDELRYFHRPFLDLSNFNHHWCPIQFLNQSYSNRIMPTKFDLTAINGDFILVEYSEQYPVLLNETGMFSKIRTYIRPQYFKAHTNSIEIDFGELSYTHASPFLWSIPRGLNIQTIENNMFIAAIYGHNCLKNDFLIIFQQNTGFYIRNLNRIYIIGQQCPLMEVPVPQSKRVNSIQRDLLQIYIYRLFLQSKEKPRRIRIDDIKRVFPRLAESSIRKRLKTSADFRRTDDCNSWILRNDFRLPTENEIHELIKPELCCAYASMTAAEQRLKDAGLYGKRNIDFINDENSIDSSELNEEILQAPWNTTRAYIDALKGKCFMQVFGIKTKLIRKTKINRDLKCLRRTVTGTDADLRRLQLKDARKLLLKFNISEKIIQSLTRWEIIDLVRTLSTQQAKEGVGGGMIKFARGAKHFQAQQFEKYKENCQKQFELENQLFTSKNEQFTDDDISDENDENAKILDEMSQTLENLLRQNKDIGMSNSTNHRKMLHIIRTYVDSQGQLYQREEFVRNNHYVIQAYAKIRQTKTDKFIKAYYALDDVEREKLRRERRRLQEQLRRVKRNEARYHQYEKQQLLLKIQQENLALIRSNQTCQSSSSSSPKNCQYSNNILSNLQLSMSEDDDNSSASSTILNQT